MSMSLLCMWFVQLPWHVPSCACQAVCLLERSACKAKVPSMSRQLQLWFIDAPAEGTSLESIGHAHHEYDGQVWLLFCAQGIEWLVL